MASLGQIFSSKLREHRRNLEKTQEWLAEKTGLSRATINRWEKNGAGTATLDEVELITKILGMSLADLLDIGAPSGEMLVSEEIYNVLVKIRDTSLHNDPRITKFIENINKLDETRRNNYLREQERFLDNFLGLLSSSVKKTS